MTDIVEAINTFLPDEQKDSFVSPSDEAISQLQTIITKAVQEAIKPLLERISELEDTLAGQHEEIAALRASVTSMEKDRDVLSDNQLIQLRLIHELKGNADSPTEKERERIERIEKLCSDAPNHEISLSELRGRLGIDKAVLSRLLKRINGDKFYLRKSTLDKRIRYLCLRPKVG